MYASRNFKTKAAFKAAVANYNETKALQEAGVDALEVQPITLFAPGLGAPAVNGREFVEGPHFPAAHTWYAEVQVKDGVVVSVK